MGEKIWYTVKYSLTDDGERAEGDRHQHVVLANRISLCCTCTCNVPLCRYSAARTELSSPLSLWQRRSTDPLCGTQILYFISTSHPS